MNILNQFFTFIYHYTITTNIRMFGLVARSSRRWLSLTRVATMVPPVTRVTNVNVASRTFSSATEEEDVTSLPDNRFEGVGQPFDKKITGILAQPLDDAEVGPIVQELLNISV